MSYSFTFDDRYASATVSSNLKDDTRDGAPRTDADILKAQAWSRGTLGPALQRLQSQYSARDPSAKTHTLPALRDVMQQLTDQAIRWGMPSPEATAMRAVVFWLESKCQTCKGTKFEVIGGTGRQSGKVCKTCRGTGEKTLNNPEIKKLVTHMEERANLGSSKARQLLGK